MVTYWENNSNVYTYLNYCIIKKLIIVIQIYRLLQRKILNCIDHVKYKIFIKPYT